MIDQWSYRDFLLSLKEKEFEFVFFDGLSKEYGQILLRHDIDFDTSLANQMAIIENELGIKATYFFLMKSDFYNVFSAKDYQNILAIRALGHKISLHFDPLVYDDFSFGLLVEARMFKTLFDEDISIISLHRPNEFFKQHNQSIFGIEHTYQAKYFHKIKYFADSTGEWRFGHPFDSEEYAAGKTLHILIHPIWWIIPGETNLDKLRAYFASRVEGLKHQFSLNCIPFRNIHNEV